MTRNWICEIWNSSRRTEHRADEINIPMLLFFFIYSHSRIFLLPFSSRAVISVSVFSRLWIITRGAVMGAEGRLHSCPTVQLEDFWSKREEDFFWNVLQSENKMVPWVISERITKPRVLAVENFFSQTSCDGNWKAWTRSVSRCCRKIINNGVMMWRGVFFFCYRPEVHYFPITVEVCPPPPLPPLLLPHSNPPTITICIPLQKHVFIRL